MNSLKIAVLTALFLTSLASSSAKVLAWEVPQKLDDPCKIRAQVLSVKKIHVGVKPFNWYFYKVALKINTVDNYTPTNYKICSYLNSNRYSGGFVATKENFELNPFKAGDNILSYVRKNGYSGNYALFLYNFGKTNN